MIITINEANGNEFLLILPSNTSLLGSFLHLPLLFSLLLVMASQLRNVCFTLFVENTEPIRINTTRNGLPIVRYYVYQFERTPDTNRLHAQGFLQLADDVKMRLRAIKTTIFESDTIHISGKYKESKSEEARDYCMKEQTREAGTVPIQWGEFRGSAQQGKRSDIHEALEAVKSGISQEDFRAEFPEPASRCVQYWTQVFGDREREKWAFTQRDVQVYVYYGEPGCGKTSRVYHEVEQQYGTSAVIYTVELTNPIWFDSYFGQPVMLIDDFSADWKAALPLVKMLRILDRYPLRLNVKSSHGWMAAERIYITSNIHPQEWYGSDNPVSIRALMRRLTHVEEIHADAN